MTTVLVTGASGFLGLAVVSALSRTGERVVGLDPAPAPADGGAIAMIPERVGTVGELARLMGAHAVTKVVHAGGVSGPMLARTDPVAICQANVGASINLIEAARAAGVHRFVYCSSAAVFGHTPSAPVPDDAPLRPTNLYGASKAACDLLLGAYRDHYGLDAIGLRLSNIYGPGRRTDCPVKTMIANALAGQATRFDWGIDCHRPYLFIADAVAAVLAALKAPPTPQYGYNIAGPEMVEMTRIGEIVRSAVPGADIAFGDATDPLGYRRETLDTTAAARDLEFSPAYGIERGIAAYLQWFREGCILPFQG